MERSGKDILDVNSQLDEINWKGALLLLFKISRCD